MFGDILYILVTSWYSIGWDGISENDPQIIKTWWLGSVFY